MPMVSCAPRQSPCWSSHAAKGETVIGATPIPADTRDTARLRRFGSHALTAVIIGTMKLPAESPTTTPYASRNCVWLAARLASTSPRPSSTAPASTTGRVPNRSLTAPQAKPPAPMMRKLSVMALETPARVQPVACVIGWRKTASDIMAPTETQLMRAPIATITQP